MGVCVCVILVTYMIIIHVYALTLTGVDDISESIDGAETLVDSIRANRGGGGVA